MFAFTVYGFDKIIYRLLTNLLMILLCYTATGRTELLPSHSLSINT